VTVYTKDKPGQSLLESYVESHPEMQLSGRLEDKLLPGQFESEGIRAELRRKGSEVQEHSPIHLFGPHRVFEDEDMDPDVAALVPAPAWQIEIGCALSREETWADALNLGEYVARQCRGAVWTGESGLTWPPQKLEDPRHIKRREDTSMDTLTIEWFSHASKEPMNSGQAFLDVLKETFPELRPYRFGTYEPLQGQLSQDEDKPFLDAWRFCGGDTASMNTLLSLKSKRPCLYASVSFPQTYLSRIVRRSIAGSPPGPRPLTSTQNIVRVNMELDVSALTDERVRERTVVLFVAMARRLECFYAQGYVERHHISSHKGRLGVTGLKEQYPLPSGHEWFGIPPVPVWLSWFGRPYKPLVAPSLNDRGSPGVREEEGGIFVRLGEYPADLHQLQPIRFEFPNELLAKRNENDPVMKLMEKLESVIRSQDGGRIEMSPRYRALAAEMIPKIDD
jgi:hypothetical protein